MRKRIVAGNWKMNKTMDEGIRLVVEVTQQLSPVTEEDVLFIFCPPFIHLHHVNEVKNDKKGFAVGAQNVHWEERGAFTGEVSADMLASIEIEYVIIGHSERRSIFKETNEQLAKKVDITLEKGLIPIFCCGESLKERNSKKHKEVVEQQLNESLFHIPEERMKYVVIAYEPVWAIGTGEVATPAQAQEMHAHIRKLIEKKYSKSTADGVSILYGGSVKPDNAKEIFSKTDVDGGLIGGASLNTDDFVAICKSI